MGSLLIVFSKRLNSGTIETTLSFSYNIIITFRLAYNLNAVVQSDHQLKAGWYEVTIGNKRLNTDPSLYKHGAAGRYPGWMEGEHPTEGLN